MTNKDLEYHKTYLRMANVWSSLSKSKRKKVGALVVKGNTIISDGYNGTPTGFPNDCEDVNGDTHWYVLHAEANAILKTARSTQDISGSTLYLTLSPCKDCCKLIIQSGIKKIIYIEEYRDLDGIKILKSSNIEIIKINEI
jgi:dCMP deaminase